MLTTDWLTIGTAGPTVDGRKISEQMLLEAAETYDPEEYQAVISSEHLLWWFGNFGEVTQVKTGTDKKGRTVLKAKIHPNNRLIEMNKQGQRLHTSMELTDDFAGTGKAYLMGLAVTDEPASLGTSALQFSKQKPCPLLISQQTESIDYSDTALPEFDDPNKESESFIKRLKQLLSREIQPDPEEYDMKDEQFNALKDLAEKQLEAAESLNNTLADKFANATFAVKPETGSETTATGNETTGKESETNILDAIDKLSTRLTDVEIKLSKAVEGKPATEKPAGTGAGEEVQFV
ncbi:GPO family capsid scaffolding protein [Bacterioplanoides sp.]|uniref:GPO family capsid scaffolding protein n=1 Tax=Bacterioplanoides sp. TaxID=2066072 RepID=UPI003B59C584